MPEDIDYEYSNVRFVILKSKNNSTDLEKI